MMTTKNSGCKMLFGVFCIIFCSAIFNFACGAPSYNENDLELVLVHGVSNNFYLKFKQKNNNCCEYFRYLDMVRELRTDFIQLIRIETTHFTQSGSEALQM